MFLGHQSAADSLTIIMLFSSLIFFISSLYLTSCCLSTSSTKSEKKLSILPSNRQLKSDNNIKFSWKVSPKSTSQSLLRNLVFWYEKFYPTPVIPRLARAWTWWHYGNTMETLWQSHCKQSFVFFILLTSLKQPNLRIPNPQYFVYLLDQLGRDTLQFINWNHANFSNSF